MEETVTPQHKKEVRNPTKQLMIFLCVIFALVVIALFVLSGETFFRTAAIITLLALIRVPGIFMANGMNPRKKVKKHTRRTLRASLLK
jgi:hypothetical protein